MSITIGIYDFFAYTIPGGFYLFTIAYACTILRLSNIDFWSLNLSTIQAIAMAILAYVTGLVFNPIAKSWYRLFKPKDYPSVVLEEFKQPRPSLEIKFRATDWPVLLALLKRENAEIAAKIEKHNATNIMLRSVSLSLMILTVIQVIQLIRSSFWIGNLVLSIAFLISSIVAARESVKVAQWFYLSIYEAVTARHFQKLDLVRLKPVVSKDKESTKS